MAPTRRKILPVWYDIGQNPRFFSLEMPKKPPQEALVSVVGKQDISSLTSGTLMQRETELCVGALKRPNLETLMTITNDNRSNGTLSADYTGSPVFSSIDIVGGIVAAAMLLLPLTAGGYHYDNVGWDQVQANSQK